MQDKFHYELEFIDYQTDVEWARKYINDWVANQTEGQITEHIRDLSPYSTGTLVSTINFNISSHIKSNSSKEIEVYKICVIIY